MTGDYTFFDTSMTCAGNSSPVPVDLRHFIVRNEEAIVDDGVAFVSAKAFSFLRLRNLWKLNGQVPDDCINSFCLQ